MTKMATYIRQSLVLLCLRSMSLAAESTCFPDQNQPQLLLSEETTTDYNSQFTAIEMDPTSKFIIAGGVSQDQEIWPQNFQAPLNAGGDFVIVLMCSDVQPTRTRWIKSYSTLFDSKKAYVSGLRVSNQSDKVVVAVQPGTPGVDSTALENIVFIVNTADGSSLGQQTKIKHSTQDNKQFGLKRNSMIFTPDDSSIYFSFMTCDQSSASLCKGFNLRDGSEYELRLRFGKMNVRTSQIDYIKEIDNHFGTAGSITVSPDGAFDTQQIYIGGAVDMSLRTQSSDAKQWLSIVLRIDDQDQLEQAISHKDPITWPADEHQSFYFSHLIYWERKNEGKWLIGLTRQKSDANRGDQTLVSLFRLEEPSGFINQDMSEHKVFQIGLNSEDIVLDLVQQVHSWIFVFFRPSQDGGSVYYASTYWGFGTNWQSFSYELHYKSLNTVTDSVFTNSFAFKDEQILGGIEWKNPYWSTGFSQSLSLEGGFTPNYWQQLFGITGENKLARSKDFGYVAPFTKEDSCFKRDVQEQTISRTILTASLVAVNNPATVGDDISFTQAACDCQYEQAVVEVADLQADKLYQMKDMCPSRGFLTVNEMIKPEIPDICPIAQAGVSTLFDITLPQIIDPASCMNDPVSIWYTYLEPISPIDYDPELLSVNIDTLTSELNVVAHSVPGKTPQDVTFKAHFQLPDTTEVTKTFVVHGSQTCDLDAIGKPAYEESKLFEFSSRESFEYQIPELDLPEGCSFTYSVRLIKTDAVKDGSYLMTKEPRGVSWLANTRFKSAHVGKYYFEVMSSPEACFVESRQFEIELTDCRSDTLQIDTADLVFKADEPVLTQKLFTDGAQTLTWTASVLTSLFGLPLCQDIQMAVVARNGSALKSQFAYSYDQSTRSGSFTLDAKNESLVGIQNLKVIAWYPSYPLMERAEKEFSVEIIPPPIDSFVDLRPYFDIKEDQQYEFIISEGASWVWYAPKPAHEDESEDHEYTITYEMDRKAEQLRFTEEFRMFSIAEGSTTPQDAGEYTISLTLTDEKGIENFKKLKIKLKIGTDETEEETQTEVIKTDQGQEELSEQALRAQMMKEFKQNLKLKYAKADADKPEVKMSKISEKGSFTLNFSQVMISLQDVLQEQSDSDTRQLQTAKDDSSYIKTDEVIAISIGGQGIDDDDQGDLNFDWTVVSQSKDVIEIQLQFESPLLVSETSIKDTLKVTFKNSNLLFDAFGQEIPSETQLEREIPPQFASKAEAKVFTALEDSTKPVETGYFASNIVLNTLIALTLQLIWSMVESQQIIVLFPLFSIILPANAKSVFAFLLHIAAFDAIPTEAIFEAMLLNLVDQTKGDEDGVAEKFERLGFESVWFMPNLASAIAYVPFYVILLLCLPLLRGLSKHCAICHSNKRNVKGQLFWSMPIGFVKGNYMVIAIVAMLNISQGQWGNMESRLNLSLSWITIIFLAIYPIAMQMFLLKRRTQLKKRSFRRQFGAAYLGLVEKDKRFFAYPLVFYYRRLSLPLTLLVFKDSLLIQFSVIFLTGMVSVLLIGHQKPFKGSNWTELGNEAVILLIMYHMFCFTEFVPDPQVRYMIGYSVVAIAVVHLLVFYIWKIISVVRSAIRECRITFALRQSRASKEIEELKRVLRDFVRARKAEINAIQEEVSESFSLGSSTESSSSSSHSESSESEQQIQQPPTLEEAVDQARQDLLASNNAHPEQEHIDIKIHKISLGVRNKNDMVTAEEEKHHSDPEADKDSEEVSQIILVDPELELQQEARGHQVANQSIFSQVVDQIVDNSQMMDLVNLHEDNNDKHLFDQGVELCKSNDDLALMFGMVNSEMYKDASDHRQDRGLHHRAIMQEEEKTMVPDSRMNIDERRILPYQVAQKELAPQSPGKYLKRSRRFKFSEQTQGLFD